MEQKRIIKLIWLAVKKLDKKGQSTGKIEIGKVKVDINSVGALGFSGSIHTPNKYYEFDYDNMKNKWYIN